MAVLTAVTSCASGLRVAPPLQLQAWVVYFDAERGLSEVREHGDLFDRISLFAFELTPDGNPIPAPNMEDMVPHFLDLSDQIGFAPWVTVVNDVRFGVDSAVPKDSVVVHEVISDPQRRNAHARAVAEMAANSGFAGVHLDYEQVPESDSSNFQDFLEVLRSELAARGLGLEVIIEPNRGPEPKPGTASVAVMGYDLFGPHSGPGPRATPEFVSELSNRASGDRDSTPGLAIALGGFAWNPGGTVEPVDWEHAGILSDESRVLRGSDDEVPHLRMQDGTELWFEDPESLLSKWDAAWRSGFRRLLLWRLGGNDSRLFDLLGDLEQGSARR